MFALDCVQSWRNSPSARQLYLCVPCHCDKVRAASKYLHGKKRSANFFPKTKKKRKCWKRFHAQNSKMSSRLIIIVSAVSISLLLLPHKCFLITTVMCGFGCYRLTEAYTARVRCVWVDRTRTQSRRIINFLQLFFYFFLTKQLFVRRERKSVWIENDYRSLAANWVAIKRRTELSAMSCCTVHNSQLSLIWVASIDHRVD